MPKYVVFKILLCFKFLKLDSAPLMWRALQGKQFFPGVFFDGAFSILLKMNSPIIRYSQLVMPQDANVLGTLFGGQMVSWMDISASKAVHRFFKKYKCRCRTYTSN
ncbi:hypothetical protein Ct9H90mP29_21360 [bacterium]|nr:MAG: hypothetical protein Ct9H90mP29_21360 [bacterium]